MILFSRSDISVILISTAEFSDNYKFVGSVQSGQRQLCGADDRRRGFTERRISRRPVGGAAEP